VPLSLAPLGSSASLEALTCLEGPSKRTNRTRGDGTVDGLAEFEGRRFHPLDGNPERDRSSSDWLPFLNREQQFVFQQDAKPTVLNHRIWTTALMLLSLHCNVLHFEGRMTDHSRADSHPVIIRYHRSNRGVSVHRFGERLSPAVLNCQTSVNESLSIETP
jgi:hypothetical protein